MNRLILQVQTIYAMSLTLKKRIETRTIILLKVKKKGKSMMKLWESRCLRLADNSLHLSSIAREDSIKHRSCNSNSRNSIRREDLMAS